MKKKRARRDQQAAKARAKANASATAKAPPTAPHAAAEAELLGALDLLRQRRAPYAEVLAGIVDETLQRFPPQRDGPIAEIGAGAGQLGEWLGVSTRARTIHTDPSRAALRALRARTPTARTAVALATHLPFGDGACAAVLGLCVFDAITPEARPATVAEVARVLRPGGRFIHFLDMATLLDGPFEKLAAARLIPIPNVFGDPADHEWPLDMLLIKGDWLTGLLDLATRVGHPFATMFGPYFALFLAHADRFDAKQATRAFKEIAAVGAAREALATLLGAVCQLAARHGYPPFEPLTFHSGKYLASVLETGFRDHGPFRIALSGICAKSTVAPSPDGTTRYRSLCLGHQRLMDHLPNRLLCPAPEIAMTPAGELRIEAGVFVFVAEKV